MKQRIVNGKTILSGLFLGCLFLPLIAMLAMEPNGVSVVEKRKLAQAPSLPASWDDWEQLAGRLDSYFSDQFGFRELLVKRYNSLLKRLDVTDEETVLAGQDGWLFLAQDGSLDYFLNAEPFGPAETMAWQQLISGRAAWLAGRGIPYLFVLAPNKNSLYPEMMPPKYQPLNTPSKRMVLDDHLSDRGASIPYLDLYGILAPLKSGPKPIYPKSDTHWNDYGATIAAHALRNRLNGTYPWQSPSRIPDPESYRWQWMEEGGDLSVIMGLQDQFREYRPVLPEGDCAPDLSESIYIGLDHIKAITCPQGKGTLLFLHDSFGLRLFPLIARDFKRTYALWRNTSAEELAKIVETVRPDIVIEERVERSLRNIPENADLDWFAIP